MQWFVFLVFAFIELLLIYRVRKIVENINEHLVISQEAIPMELPVASAPPAELIDSPPQAPESASSLYVWIE